MENGEFYNENKINRFRRIKLAAVVLVTFFLQNTQEFIPHISNLPIMLLVPLTVCIGMFEREIWGMIFGLFSGVLLDAFSSQTLSFHSIALTCLGFTCGLLITGIFRNNLKTCVLFSAAALFLYNTIYFFIYCFSGNVYSDIRLYWKVYFVSALYTFLFTPVFYLIVRAVCVKKKRE